MKAQTSVEFLLILSAVSILSLSLVSAYKSNMSSEQYTINSAIQNSNSIDLYNSSSASPVQHPGIFVNIPLNSTANAQNMMQVVMYGCINGTGSVSLKSGYILFSQSSIRNLSIQNLALFSLAFDPLSSGLHPISVNYSISCGKTEMKGNSTFITYSAVPSGNSSGPGSSATLYAYISERNESVSYPLESQGSVESIGGFNHCTTVDFWGNAYPVWNECGTPNAWDYRIESQSCYWDGPSTTETYCVIPSGSGQSTYSINSSTRSYSYYFLLSIASGYGLLTSKIMNHPDSQLFDGNYPVGNVSIINVSGASDYQMPDFIGNSTAVEIANPELYQQYVQAKNNMYSLLSYYNNTEVSPSTASSIQQAISSYETAASELSSSISQGPPACSVVAGNYTCKSSYPLSYVINVETNLSLQNQTLYYEGSMINVTSK